MCARRRWDDVFERGDALREGFVGFGAAAGVVDAFGVAGGDGGDFGVWGDGVLGFEWSGKRWGRGGE